MHLQVFLKHGIDCLQTQNCFAADVNILIIVLCIAELVSIAFNESDVSNKIEEMLNLNWLAMID